MCLLTLNRSPSFAIGYSNYPASHSCGHQPSENRFLKRVRFNENVAVRRIGERSSEMLPEDKSQTYYSKDELRRFESELIEVRKSLSVKARFLSKLNPERSLAQHVSSILESDETLRGFEVRFCPTRCDNKSKVLKAVLQYHEELRISEPSSLPTQRELALARAYSELNQVSRMQALQTARKDEICAYCQDEDHFALLPTCPIPCSRPLAIVNYVVPALDTTKRRDFAEKESQRKKCRLY